MTPRRAVASTILVMLIAIGAVSFGGWHAVVLGFLLLNVGAVAIALWRGRSALSAAPRSVRGRIPDGVMWC